MIPKLSFNYWQATYVVPEWLTQHHKELTEGETRYALIEHPFKGNGVQEHWDKGMVCIQDAILPVSAALLNDDSVNPVKHDVADWKNDPFYKYVEEDYRKAKEFDKKNRKKFIKGRLIHVGVGDGYATYIITKVNTKTVDIEWRGWSADRWVDRLFGHGGRFRREDIERFVPMTDSPLRGIFDY